MRAIWRADMPFLLAVIKCIAASQMLILIWLRSISEPTVTENGLRQSLHL